MVLLGRGASRGAPQQFALEGLFLEARRLEEEENGAGMKGAVGELARKPPAGIFILDELNSLDIDLQGILLRVLEQGEVMALFGLKKEYIQHLIVGIVNEDPEEISHESDLKNLLLEKGKLGTLISGFLYETLRRTRRLREDLYHRLKRRLYLRVPEIRERPEDIPMLFYLFASKADRLAASRSLIVNLDAYRLLMDPRLLWPGNIRQVQAVARSSAEEALADSLHPSGSGADVVVRREHVLKVLRREFKGVRLDGVERDEKSID